MSKKLNIDGVVCACKKNAIAVKDTFLIDYDEVDQFSKDLKSATGKDYKRSASSWRAEIISHKMLFDVHLFKEHVVDTDLEENEKLHRRVAYRVLYLGFITLWKFSKWLGAC